MKKLIIFLNIVIAVMFCSAILIFETNGLLALGISCVCLTITFLTRHIDIKNGVGIWE